MSSHPPQSAGYQNEGSLKRVDNVAASIKNKSASQSFLKGAMILSVSMIAVKLCGAVYKIMLSNIFKDALGDIAASWASGISSNAYELYIPLFTLASAGFPIAVSRLISENSAKERYNDVRQIHKVSKPFFVIMGVICFLIMAVGSYFYAGAIESPYSLYPLLCLSPTIFFGCLVSIYRGYFEGLRNMAPTALSEIVESAFKLFAGLSGAYMVLKIGLDQYKSTSQIFGMSFESEEEAMHTLISFSVSAAIMGITLGSFFAFVFLYFRYKLGKHIIPEEYYQNSIEAMSKKETFKTLLKVAVPIALASLVMNIAGLVDSMIVQKVLYNMALNNGTQFLSRYNGLLDGEISLVPDNIQVTIHTTLWGCYANALTIMQIVTATTQVFGTSAMPNVTSAYTRGNKKELKTSIETVIKLTTLFTFPSGLGLFVLSKPITSMLFKSEVIRVVTPEVLNVMGISVIFIAFSTPICSMLQGVGRIDLPLKLFTVGMIIKIIVNYVFVSVVEINIVGAAIGSLVAYLIICIAALYQLIKHSGIIPNFLTTIIKPFIAAILCAVSAYLFYPIFFRYLNTLFSVILTIIVAAIFYGAALFLLKAFTENELKALPKGDKIIAVLKRWRLLS